MANTEHRCENREVMSKLPFVQLCGCNKLNTNNWLEHIPSASDFTDIIEVRFKNTRKGFFKNTNDIRFTAGDVVAVEASPGHDIGIVSLTGGLVLNQMAKYGVAPDSEDLKKVYRKAKPADIDKWKEAISQEHTAMIKARQISSDLKLAMKIGDVEYQGDKTKAIFYYIADERVDFRELIKVLAEQFRIRVEMRQIGARQEAGRIGGIGSCGRELCCSSWMTNFVSVTTNSARYQEVSLNPQKLAGQCGKLKCCLNYELDAYLDAQKDFPPKNITLETKKGQAWYVKTDIHRGIYWYSVGQENSTSMIPVPVERVKEIIKNNKAGEEPDLLVHEVREPVSDILVFEDDTGKGSLTRFEGNAGKKAKKKRKKRRNN